MRQKFERIQVPRAITSMLSFQNMIFIHIVNSMASDIETTLTSSGCLDALPIAQPPSQGHFTPCPNTP